MKNLLKDRRLYVIFSITVISVMGVASLTPAFPKMSVALHLNKTQIGLLISAFTFPGIFLTPVAGIAADRWGRKKVLVPSLFIFALVGFALFFTRNFHIMILFRLIQGIGAAPLGSLNTTLVGDFYKGSQRPEAMGYNASVLSMSTASYPLIGGLLAGFAWYYPFLLPLLAIPAALFLIVGIDEPEIERPSGFKSYFKAMADSMLNKEVIAIFMLGILTFIILYGALITYMPFLLHQKFGLSAPMIGMMASLGSISSVVVATQIGRLTKKYGSVALLKTAFTLYMLTNLTFPYLNHLALFILPILLFGAAQALNMPSLQTILANMAPDNLRGAFMSLNGMNLRIGQTLGPLVIGVGYTWGKMEGAYLLVAGIALVGLLVVLTMINESKIKAHAECPT